MEVVYPLRSRMDGPGKRARLVLEEFECWKESIGKCCHEILPQAKEPLVTLLVRFIAAVDRRKNGSGEKTFRQVRMLAEAVDGSVNDGDFERFFRQFMLEFLSAMRMDLEFVTGIAKEALRRLDEWPGGMF